ncbi:MAG: hypothetical protein UX31_C0015G0002 [Candidatus Nomurabacteria bacterium GW2011_GWA1_46_11]|uniref:Uncharacterized protein n=1 Tax=Candidatus Nomurabacteria bacterium GW2011_GWA1_46_11 TaxID=1618732 RepID=A0A0G1NMM4_9BACT|nr:MAG: hypothetical protein UX31_C0015G0002 [Candidatus Nomurabacteria bacterium GW2011_GWA1_46_11]
MVEHPLFSNRHSFVIDLHNRQAQIGGNNVILEWASFEERRPSVCGRDWHRNVFGKQFPVRQMIQLYFTREQTGNIHSYTTVCIEFVKGFGRRDPTFYNLRLVKWDTPMKFGEVAVPKETREALVGADGRYFIYPVDDLLRLSHEAVKALTGGSGTLRDLVGSDLEWCKG